MLVKAESKNPVYCTVKKRNEVPESLDKKIINDFLDKRKNNKSGKINLNYSIKNTDRAIGAKLSSFITNSVEGLEPESYIIFKYEKGFETTKYNNGKKYQIIKIQNNEVTMTGPAEVSYHGYIEL